MLDRIFMKKTRRGNILKIVREHYVRDDLSCGSQLCTSETCTSGSNKIVLEAKPVMNSTLFPDVHYIVPDTNIILHQVTIKKPIHLKTFIFIYLRCYTFL
jgi:exosome complex exonuclease DIS3/RRP44